MAVYFVVFAKSQEELTGEAEIDGAKILESPKDARVAKVEAESIVAAQRAVEHFYPGDVTTTPVVVTEAQFKES